MLSDKSVLVQKDHQFPDFRLACIRILQLYCKVFDISDYLPYARKNCKNCKCTRDNHEIVSEHGARPRLGLNPTNEGLEPKSIGYSFIPCGLTTSRQVDKFYSTLPSHEVPRLGTKGENLRSQRIVKQLPKQDLALDACKFVESSNISAYKDFITARNEIALDIGLAKNAPPNTNCAGCEKPLQTQLPCVSAPRMGNLLWHPGCFKCTTCSDLLVDLAYCVYEDNLYCERHYSENLKPRCASCDEPLALLELAPGHENLYLKFRWKKVRVCVCIGGVQ